MFLKMTTCYVITPPTHQWYKVNTTTNEIIQDHESALYVDKVAHMVPLPPAEPPAINAYMTILRVTLQQNQDS